jgi:predicted DCC family thiol-disulfide oxidoreductase YuxK
MSRTLTRLLTARRPARAVGLFRIGIGLATLARGLKTSRDLYWLGHDPTVVPARLYDWAPRLETVPEVMAVTVVWLLAAAALTLGYRARLAAGVLCAMSIGLHVVDQNFWAHHVYFMTLVLLLLTIVDSDASLSLRWLRDRRPERDVLWWPVWLVQVQLTLAYLFTAIAKLNPAFLDGAVLQAAIGFPAEWEWLARWIALPALGAEFFIGVALWVPALRPWALLLGFGLHGLVPVLMGPYAGLLAFTLLVWSVYILFIDDRPQSRLVVWDDTCRVCRGWVTWLRRLDWLRVHRFEGASRPEALAEAGVTAEEASDEIKLRDGSRTIGGFAAVAAILESLPIGFLWARLLTLPPINWLGAAAYRRVAERRHCLLPPR